VTNASVSDKAEIPIKPNLFMSFLLCNDFSSTPKESR
jgi:hypothetical protein